MRQDILGVLEALDHLEVARLHSRVEGIGVPFATLVHVRDYFGLR